MKNIKYFLEGILSINIFGNDIDIDLPSDTESLKSDWEAIGNDFKKVL